ncbi:MAG: cyanate transporter [Burkholderia contaminans]|uniref:Cyanate transporter n=1 Tax=Burkholderia contaminans TaxID=488447 RepID=A0AAP4R3I2_9BURK|nr:MULTISPECIES: cyanate transporter [Burkholderia]MBD1414697.1 cyanate transporter [Burkholderia contaminans]MBH9667082.1 cyanate transporter [Burkholderia contaminans]MBH9673369.1 cyanate transporter [Burkholderia contaminans]MBH9703412.1 cyanate transporter [Burkholderia contaminans]MBH9721235.1 cyanate transporter [Burkholderia contaminans]
MSDPGTAQAVHRPHAASVSCGALALLVLAGLNLRPFLTAFGPVLDVVRADTGLGFRAAALLTTLPFVLMGVVAGVGVGLARRVGEQRALTVALALIAAGCTARLWTGGSAGLIGTAIVAGAGVAVIQALVPGLAKRWFVDRLPLAMGLYSAALVGGGAFGAVASPWLAAHGGWHLALAVWAVPALMTLALWRAKAPRDAVRATAVSVPLTAFARVPRAWLLALFFGLSNSGYASLVAWLPAFYHSIGMSPQASGNLLAWMALFQAIGALAMPMLAKRSPDRRAVLWLTLALQAAGFIGFATLPALAPWLWVASVGLGLGGFFSMSLIVTLDHLPDARLAGALAAFVQGIGFLTVAASPWLIGWLRDAGGGFAIAWWIHLGVIVAMAALNAAFAPAGYRHGMARITGAAR